MNLKKRKVLIPAGMAVVLAATMVIWWISAARGRFSTPPDPMKSLPGNIAGFIASEQFRQMPDREKQDYMVKMLYGQRSPQAVNAFLTEVGKLSPAEIEKFRDHAIEGFLRVRFLQEAMRYRALKSLEERQRFMDRSFEDLETLGAWREGINNNPALRKAIPVHSYMDTFKMVLGRTSPVERAAMETYLYDSFHRYVERETRETVFGR